ncbi:unnamed protein product, partial [Urochloa humidicola]
ADPSLGEVAPHACRRRRRRWRRELHVLRHHGVRGGTAPVLRPRRVRQRLDGVRVRRRRLPRSSELARRGPSDGGASAGIYAAADTAGADAAAAARARRRFGMPKAAIDALPTFVYELKGGEVAGDGRPAAETSSPGRQL